MAFPHGRADRAQPRRARAREPGRTPVEREADCRHPDIDGRAANPRSGQGLVNDYRRSEASYTDGSIDIALRTEDGSPVSPINSLVVTERSRGLTHFDLHLSPHEGISYHVDIPYATHAGRAFRDLAFLPNWRMGMLLMQSIPAIRALGGETRLQASKDTLLLPGYLLAHLDYDLKMLPDERRRLYLFYLQTIASSAVQEQLLLRLCRDVPYLSAKAILELLRSVLTPSPSRGYRMLLNELWHHLDTEDRPEIVALVATLRERYPTASIEDLDPDLRSAASL